MDKTNANAATTKSAGPARQRGYSLVWILLLLGSMAVVGTIRFKDLAQSIREDKAKSAGIHMRELNDAIDGYITKHALAIITMRHNSDMTSGACAGACSWYCEPVAAMPNTCKISGDYAHLATEGFLAAGWNNQNPWGSQYSTYVTRFLKKSLPFVPTATNPAPPVPTPSDYSLIAITTTKDEWREAGSGSGTGLVELGLLGMAVESGGNDLGATMDMVNPSNVSGRLKKINSQDGQSSTNRGWSIDNAGSLNPDISKFGLLVARAGLVSSREEMFDGLLPRDGSRVMRGDLNANNKMLNNVQDVFINEKNTTLSAALPNVVFKGSYRVTNGDTVKFPNCSIPSAQQGVGVIGSSDSSAKADVGYGRILISPIEYFMLNAGYYNGTPALDPYSAYSPANRGRASVGFSARATMGAGEWGIVFGGYQDSGLNNHLDQFGGIPVYALASVYCYYGKDAASACSGEVGCYSSGTGSEEVKTAYTPPAGSETYVPIAAGNPYAVMPPGFTVQPADVVTGSTDQTGRWDASGYHAKTGRPNKSRQDSKISGKEVLNPPGQSYTTTQ